MHKSAVKRQAVVFWLQSQNMAQGYKRLSPVSQQGPVFTQFYLSIHPGSYRASITAGSELLLKELQHFYQLHKHPGESDHSGSESWYFTLGMLIVSTDISKIIPMLVKLIPILTSFPFSYFNSSFNIEIT